MSLLKSAKSLPQEPGIYFFRSRGGKVIYVGKAVNLRRRVVSYFQKNHPDPKTDFLVSEIAKIKFQTTETALEALILEANAIKRYQPKYNIKEKDDKSFSYVWITKEMFPRVAVVRQTDLADISEKKPRLFGPFLSSRSLQVALDIARRVMPYRSCQRLPKRQCLYGYLGLCGAPCVGKIGAADYRVNIRWLIRFLSGDKKGVVRSLTAQMKRASKAKNYELAALLRDKVNALNHVRDVAVLARDDAPTIYRRVEGYDISNISGQWATGSMVVFRDGQPEKSEYRKFRIKSVSGANDVAMLGEVLRRRLGHADWSWPDLIVLDGGLGQINTARRVLKNHNKVTSLVGIAKGPDRKGEKMYFAGPVAKSERQLFLRVRDEAHRFAAGYYKKLHGRSIFP